MSSCSPLSTLTERRDSGITGMMGKGTSTSTQSLSYVTYKPEIPVNMVVTLKLTGLIRCHHVKQHPKGSRVCKVRTKWGAIYLPFGSNRSLVNTRAR